MIYYAAVPLTLLLVVMQISTAPLMSVMGVHADLLVVWLGCWGIIRGRSELLVLIPVAGFGLGLISREPLGASLLGLLPIAGLSMVGEYHWVRSRFLAALAVVLVAGLAFELVQTVAALAGGDPFTPPLDILRTTPRAAMLDMLTAAIWYWPMRFTFARRTRGVDFRRL